MRIAAVINSLSGGGAERTLLLLAGYWAQAGHQVTIVTFKSSSKSPELTNNIQHIALATGRDKSSLLVRIITLPQLIFNLRKTLLQLQPDTIVSFMDQANILTLLANYGTGVPVVVSERVYPAFSSLMTTSNSSLVKLFISRLRNTCYRFAATIVVQTARAGNYFPKSLQQKITVIPNPIEAPASQGSSISLPENAIVSIGRLVHQKRFDLLIRSFSNLIQDFSSWTLHIIGDGPLKAELEQQISSLNLSQHIMLHGYQSNVSNLLSQASIYVLASDYEGFPVVLGEAMYAGVPVIASDCLTGPRELIGSAEAGLLFPSGDCAALSQSIATLMRSPSIRASLSESAKTRIKEYSTEKIGAIWLELFNKIR